MKRNTLNFVIDAITAMVMLGMIATGLLLRFVLPPGSGSRRVLWGWDRHDWGDLHFWLAVGIGAIIILHVALHWQWVCVTALRCVPGCRQHPSPREFTRNLSGASLILLLAGILGCFVWIARAATSDVRGAEAGVGADRAQGRNAAAHEDGRDDRLKSGDRSVRGSTKLSEAAEAYGLTVEVARERLKVPQDVPADEQLGRLSAKYGFTMQQARQRLGESLTDAELE